MGRGGGAFTGCQPPIPPPRRREKSVLLSSNRKLERKVKELSIQIDDERQHVSDQKDQVGGADGAARRRDSPPEGFPRVPDPREILVIAN